MKYRYMTSHTGNLIRTARVYSGEDHFLSKKLIRWEAIRVVQRLISCGHEAYIVGGSIRDLLLEITPKDFDVVTDASPRKIRSIFRNAYVIGRRFLLVHVLFGDTRVEVATFRSLSSQENEQQWGRIDEDVQRRDFTVNALYYAPSENIILDFVDAMEDLENRILRPLIPLDNIFVEDPVRLIRAVKYSKSSQLEYTKKLRKKLLQSPFLLKHVSETRLTEEFLKILDSPVFAQIFIELFETGILVYLLPAIDKYLRQKSFFYTQWVDDLIQCEDSFSSVEKASKNNAKNHEQAPQNQKLKVKRVRSGQVIYALCRQILLETHSTPQKDHRFILRVTIKELLAPLLPPNQFIVSAAQEFIRQEL